ncbi:hypothetical protein KMW28_20035 [Flammeovirga yaeyamensis]|uniref:Uncharacterized protein n=1 Tax=Flammeovirga yaeyamensis TaxID=367791 RepID=A0AAX1N6L6_9BACT|nr:hypothetical protein [Flammeovirga yaeyamensis]MBB3701044.1 hypothetical protein [Flammeovirga yaeyamensis]NMF38124.1 hypothetical protein [Flammeovirga yaeyamensis]QWG01895.1 hypothetical protein KMW28_20035 [Flammeovirga yaeyamensis]
MKRLPLYILLLFTLVSSTVFAQKTKKKKKEKTLITEAQDEIEKQGEIQRDSSVFYFENWMMGNIVFKNGKVKKQVPLLFDLEHDQIEYQEIKLQQMYGGLEMLDTTINVVEVSEVKEFSITFIDDSNENVTSTSIYHFVNGDQFTREGVPAIGIYELVAGGEGKMGVLAYPFLLKTAHLYNSMSKEQNEIQRQRYGAYNMNNKEVFYSYQLKEKLYFLTQAGEIIPTDKKKKVIVKDFIGREEEMKEYMKTMDTYYKSKEGLRQLVEFYNNQFN